MNIAELEIKSLDDLQEMAKDLEISGYTRLRKQELIFGKVVFKKLFKRVALSCILLTLEHLSKKPSRITPTTKKEWIMLALDNKAI